MACFDQCREIHRRQKDKDELTLQHIDVVQLKTRQAVLDGVKDMLNADVV